MSIKRLKTWLFMAVLQAATIFLYFWGIRPFRGMFSEWIGSTLFSFQSESVSYIESFVREGVTIHTTYYLQSTELIFSYAPQFGFFFLISILGLNLLRPGLKVYLFLIVFHFFMELISLGSVAMALNGIPIGFVIADFLLLYFSPLVSLGFILVVVLQKKGKLGEKIEF